MIDETFERWPDFLEAVTSATRDFESEWESGSAVPFFRGHASTSYKLAPGLFRPVNGLYYSPYDEANLYYEFRSRAGNLLGSELKSWEVLFYMQHHGVPTRLLDWSESFAAALFFALKEAEQDIDIWFLDPYTYNKASCGTDEILDMDDDFEGDYKDYFVDQSLIPKWKHAVAVYPCRRIPRLSSQGGLFTIHADPEPLESTAADELRRFRLKASALQDARQYLKVCGVNDFSLFPDLDGLSRLLRSRFRPQNSPDLWAENPQHSN